MRFFPDNERPGLVYGKLIFGLPIERAAVLQRSRNGPIPLLGDMLARIRRQHLLD